MMRQSGAIALSEAGRRLSLVRLYGHTRTSIDNRVSFDMYIIGKGHASLKLADESSLVDYV
jgi:hypothetical protein